MRNHFANLIVFIALKTIQYLAFFVGVFTFVYGLLK